MKRLIQSTFFVLALLLGSTQIIAQDVISISELNTYTNLTEFNQDSIAGHPLVGVEVTYTAVVVSYPKSSGLATPNDNDGDGTTDDIGRLHMFVTDTAAVTQGRDGMSIQIVESDYELVESFTRGDVVTFVGSLGFFNATAQMTVNTATLLGNVNSVDSLAKYAPLLDPWVVTVDELNTLNADGTHEINIANYGKYNGAYVKIENATVSNVSVGDRPNWAISNNGSRIYAYDTSLRYRNDRVTYLPTYNFRQDPDPTFEPPVPGAVVNVSGFINLVGDDPDGNVTASSQAFSINPFEDGVVWLNGTRFVDGEDVGGETFDWPNDLEVIGLPPVFSNVFQSDSAVTSSDDVTVSATVVGVDSKTVTSVDLVYSAAGVTDTLSMTAAGDVYTATIPAQANFTPVSFYMLATDSDGLVGRDPISGSYGYFVQDGPINTVSLLQETADGGPGASPLLGAGIVSMEVTGLIVSQASTDGVIVLQDGTGAWSGIFLEQTSETQALLRGDEITVTAGEVIEAAVASNSNTITQLVSLEFTVNSSDNDVETVIPSLMTDSIAVWTVDGELEPYEGMLVKFENAQVTERASFGEYIVQNGEPTTDDGAVFNEDIRSSDQIGDVNVEGDFNESVRLFKPMTAAYGVVASAFGAAHFHPRNASDLVASDGNIFQPKLDFSFGTPADSAEVTVTGARGVDNIQASWTPTEDYDGDDLTYEWVLYSEDASTIIVSLPSNNAAADAVVDIPVDAVDGLLEGAGLAVGESATFVWNVRVSDGSDTLAISTYDDEWFPVYRTITLERGVISSNEGDFDGVPTVYSLEQNYPNPFNPATKIEFSLPQTSKVTLTVFDMLGRKVATLINGEQMEAAKHSVQFDASALASGMYIYRLDAGSYISTRKMMLIK